MPDQPQDDAVALRAAKLNELLSYAFDELLWISEYPNRTREHPQDSAIELAERAGDAIAHIEYEDPGA